VKGILIAKNTSGIAKMPCVV